MADALTIREMSEDDRPEWLRLYENLFPNGSAAGMNREIDRILVSPTRAGFCAEADGKLLGFAEYNIREFANGCVSQPVPFLEGIWVTDAARRSGVATALIAHIEGIAKAQGYDELGSDVEWENKLGIALHNALGFEETERVVFFRKDLS